MVGERWRPFQCLEQVALMPWLLFTAPPNAIPEPPRLWNQLSTTCTSVMAPANNAVAGLPGAVKLNALMIMFTGPPPRHAIEPSVGTHFARRCFRWMVVLA